MIRCPACQAEVAASSRFCPQCGEALARSCPSCQQLVGAGMKFCPSCGTHMEGAETPAESGEESRVQLATVLFGDVKGFTAMSADLQPEEVTAIMNDCFDALTQIVVKYDGWVGKYIGDAIMTAFGWPTAHEDDPVRAIRAALEMQQALTRFAARLKATRGFELAMRIGINSGQVFVARVGGRGFEKVDLMGSTVNLASRLEHQAEPGSILVGETTYRLAKHAFEFKALPSTPIRGLDEPVNVFVPLRPKMGAPDVKGGGKLRLVGRQAELALLDSYLNEARSGQGRLVAVVADPGLGKSRLVEEFWKRHLDQGVGRIYAAAPSFGESMPYSMLSNFIRSLLLGEATEREITVEELRKRLVALLPGQIVNDAVALLGNLLGVEGAEEREVSQLTPQQRQSMLTNILKVLLVARSQQQPLLLTLEDLHWMDGASLDVLDPILTLIQNLPVMALLAYRPQFSHTWSGLPFYREIGLEELPEEHARDLLSEFFGSNAIPAEVGERVIEKAGGNPFFIEQLLNNLVESEAVVQQDGRWVLAGDIATLSVPDTIQEILQARIDQLPRGARSVLQVAAVIGRIFMYRLLEAIVGAESNVQDHLKLLREQEFVIEKSHLPTVGPLRNGLRSATQVRELVYMFTHALTQDVVYHGLPESRRRALHERVAQTIESLGISAASEQLALLAVHYQKTANREKALEYALAAGERSRQLYANQDAVGHFLRALEILEQEHDADTPELTGRPARKLEVLEALGDLYKLLGTFEEAYNYYSRAKEESIAPSDLARILRKLGDLAESRARYHEALTCYRNAEHALATVDDPAEQVNVWLALARMDRSRGALEAAAATCLRALSLASRVDQLTGAALYFELGEVEKERGHLRGASGYLEAAKSVWDQLGSLEKRALVSGALADVSFNRGELAEALGHFEKALEAQRRILDRQGMASTLYGIGRIRVAMGDLDEAIKCYTEALAIATEIDYRYLASNCMVQLGTIYLERGEVERAQELIAKAYLGFKQIRNWRGSANALVARARLLRAQGDPDHARTILRRAWNLADEMNDPWLRAQISISESELEEETGRLDRSAERAAAGISMARNLSDPRLVARGERILGRVRAREGRLDEALSLLSSSTATLRRSGAQVDAARAALDYVIAALGQPAHGGAPPTEGTGYENTRGGDSHQMTHEMLSYALDTFDRTRSGRDLRISQMVAERVNQLLAPPAPPAH